MFPRKSASNPTQTYAPKVPQKRQIQQEQHREAMQQSTKRAFKSDQEVRRIQQGQQTARRTVEFADAAPKPHWNSSTLSDSSPGGSSSGKENQQNPNKSISRPKFTKNLKNKF